MGENLTKFSARIGLSTVILVGLFRCELGLAQTSSGVPILSVLVFNYSEASPALLVGAERETSRIFDQSGIHLAWTYCPPLPSSDSLSMCEGEPAPDEIRVRVLARHLTADSVFGVAMAPTFASVYYEAAQRLTITTNSEFELSAILGCLIAHEIGHLLLGHNHHTVYGIMKGRWEIPAGTAGR